MNIYLQTTRLCLGLLALCTALGSAALSLDRVTGATLIGQPLDMTGLLRLDAGDDPGALCLEADVFHGDNRVDATRVTITVDRVNASEARFRIRSSLAVDEPVVTLYVRAGCVQRSARRYVLLADVPSDTASNNAALANRAAAAAAPVVTLPVAGNASNAAAAKPARPARPARPGKVNPTNPDAGSAPASGAAPAVAAAAAPTKALRAASRAASGDRKLAGATPRLTLEPLDLSADGQLRLRSSRELLSATNINDQRRAEVMAWWRAINAQPQDVLREAQRVQALEADAKGLRDSSVRTQTELTDLRGQLERAQQARYWNPLVVGLALLLLAAVAGLGYLWHRGRRAQGRPDWWRGEKANADSQPGGLDSLLPRQAVYPGGQRGPTNAASVDLDLDFDLGTDEPFSALQANAVTQDGFKKKLGGDSVIPWSKPVQQPVATEDLSMSRSGSDLGTLAEDLYDVQRQADFFVALGDYPQAIELLKDHISTQPQTSALAYLDLLSIYHQLERRDDYETLRLDFNQAFNAQAPQFDLFGNLGDGLEAHPKALSRIEALWPSSKVLDLLEESIFRKPGQDGGEAFDLEAYRELLLLHSLAKEVVSPRPLANAKPRAAMTGKGGANFSTANSKSWAEMDSSRAAQSHDFSETKMQPLGAKSAKTLPAKAPLAVVDVDFDLGDDDTEMPSAVLESTPVDAARTGLDDDATVALGTKPVVGQTAQASGPNSHLLEFDMSDATTPRESKL